MLTPTPSTLPLRLVPASPAEIPLIQELARLIWNQCYPTIISQEQIDFMLGWMYSTGQLEREMTAENVSFFLLRHMGTDAGYAALSKTGREEEWHLHKLYLLPGLHGQGLGSQALRLLKQFAKAQGASRLSLRVNRRNHSAIHCYSRNGFAVDRQITSSIGNGFVMDDYWMSVPL